MIDDLQTPKHKTNHIIEDAFPSVSLFNFLFFDFERIPDKTNIMP
jgi:hypothetical protein